MPVRHDVHRSCGSDAEQSRDLFCKSHGRRPAIPQDCGADSGRTISCIDGEWHAARKAASQGTRKLPIPSSSERAKLLRIVSGEKSLERSAGSRWQVLAGADKRNKCAAGQKIPCPGGDGFSPAPRGINKIPDTDATSRSARSFSAPLRALQFEGPPVHTGGLDMMKGFPCNWRVWAITELIVEGTPGWGIIEWTRREAERTNAPLPDPNDSSQFAVSLIAPPGISHVALMSGRSLCVPSDRVVSMTVEDSKPLLPSDGLQMFWTDTLIQGLGAQSIHSEMFEHRDAAEGLDDTKAMQSF
jgi:hypothetical protein